MQIKVGEYDVFKDGTIVGNENESIDFILNKDIGFVIRVLFANDADQKEPRVSADQYEKNGIVITFYNYNNSLGIGNAAPIPIGRLSGRQLLLNYRIYSLTKGGKAFHYTWLLGKEVVNGK